MSVIIPTALKVTERQNKKAELSQRWPSDAPYVWVPWKFSSKSPWVCPRLYFSFCSDWAYKCACKISIS